MPLSERAQELVGEIVWNQHLNAVLSRGDYEPNDEQLAWEECLEREIRDTIADLRFAVLKWSSDSEVDINPEVFGKADALKIDRKRVSRIIMAAEAGFTWDQAVGAMMQKGMKREDAEEVTENLAIGIRARRSREHHARAYVRERFEFRMMIVGLVVFGAVVGLGAVYWTWVGSAFGAAVHAARQCFAAVQF